uniref:Unannotated protein n=1 Tax=freshwater metagenome TaxID=449393 RepID=A0A6J7NAW3_9ZZZZ
MNPVLATEPLEPACHVDDTLDVRVHLVHCAQFDGRLVTVLELGVQLQARVQRCVPAHDERGHRLGDLVADAVRVAEHAGRVSRRSARLDGGEGNDLRHVVAAVSLCRVPDHLVPIPGVEVHVDIGHGHTAGIEEALKDQVVLNRIEVRDPEAVRNRTARSRSPTGADTDPGIAGVLDEVPHDQEVRREPHVRNDLELVRETLHHRWREVVAPTLAGTLPSEEVEVVRVVLVALGDREEGELSLAELDLDVRALRDPQRVVAGLGIVPEEAPHLGCGLEVVLVALELEALRVAHERTGLHAEQRVVGLVVRAVGVVRVVRREDRCTDAAGDLDQLRIGLVLGSEAVILQLDEEVVPTEDVLQAGRLLERTLLVAVEETLQHVPTETAGGGNQARGVLVQQFPVHPRLVVVALEERKARELDEVAVPLVALGEQREVVIQLLAALGVAPRVVNLAPARRAFAAVIMGKVCLDAENRLDPLLVALLVEVQDAVHVPVVGDADSGLTVGDRLGHEGIEPCRTVEHRVLGVDVEVGERLPHGGLLDDRAGMRTRPATYSNVIRQASRRPSCAESGPTPPRAGRSSPSGLSQR